MAELVSCLESQNDSVSHWFSISTKLCSTEQISYEIDCSYTVQSYLYTIHYNASFVHQNSRFSFMFELQLMNYILFNPMLSAYKYIA
jgi:hypothetical protein